MRSMRPPDECGARHAGCRVLAPHGLDTRSPVTVAVANHAFRVISCYKQGDGRQLYQGCLNLLTAHGRVSSLDQRVMPRAQVIASAPGATSELRGVAPVLEVRDLHVHFTTPHGLVRAVEGVSYSVLPGETVAIVGESGSGKSVSALAVMKLLPPANSRIVRGSISLLGRDLLALSNEEMRKIRGRDMAMIFQEPMTSLNPVLTIGLQVTEPLLAHMGMGAKAARARAIELLTLVGITEPETRLAQHPHELSGGMRQRVMIAIGLACNPKLLIADEPTTALDVTIQAQILELMKDLSRRFGIAVVIITHNLGIVARYADRVNVMYAARIVESGPAEAVFSRQLHPYSRGLLSAVPRLDRGRSARLQTIDGAPRRTCCGHPRAAASARDADMPSKPATRFPTMSSSARGTRSPAIARTSLRRSTARPMPDPRRRGPWPRTGRPASRS